MLYSTQHPFLVDVLFPKTYSDSYLKGSFWRSILDLAGNKEL